ncbi:MAG: flavodoxin family protein [Zoogloeaceae bacterium]|jgi:multimeric flavodoxin WrbA|nr:flavodoxin family protein [Zoogloeaceae bacterium]
MSENRIVAIVYYSGYGHTARLAEAVWSGANAQEGVEARLYDVTVLGEEDWTELDAAAAIVFGTPTYMGSAAAKYKAFMEESSKRWFARLWRDKLAAGFTCSASQAGDKQNTLAQLVTFACQHGMIWVGLDLLAGNNSSHGSPDDLNRLGASLGVMAQANADEGAAAMRTSDLETARHLGVRVATQTLRLHGLQG